MLEFALKKISVGDVSAAAVPHLDADAVRPCFAPAPKARIARFAQI